MTPPISPTDLQRILASLPPERHDPFPHLADLSADALLMRQLADQRALSVAQFRKVSRGAKDLLADWLDAGWLHTAKLKDQP